MLTLFGYPNVWFSSFYLFYLDVSVVLVVVAPDVSQLASHGMQDGLRGTGVPLFEAYNKIVKFTITNKTKIC